MGLFRAGPIAACVMLAGSPALSAASTVTLIPSAGQTSSCSMTIGKELGQGGNTQRFSETWGRELAITGASGAVTYKIKHIPQFQKYSVFKFAPSMSKSAPTPIEPRDYPGEERDRVTLAAAFPESTLYGRTVQLGEPVTPLPEFRSDYSKELLSDGFVKESFDQSLVFAREETFEGAAVYVFEGGFQHEVARNDGARDSARGTALMRVDKRSLLMRQASLTLEKDFLDPRFSDPLTHKVAIEWRCQIR